MTQPLENRPELVADGGYAVLHGGTPTYNTDNTLKGWQVTSATSTTVVLHSSANITDDYFNGATIWITAGTGSGQSAVITDYVGATRTVTVATWTTNPDTTSYYVIDNTGLRALSDNASLRAGTYSSATAVAGDLESFISAHVHDYDTVSEEWTIRVPWHTKTLASDESTPASGTVSLIRFEILGSRVGYPEFPDDLGDHGFLVLEKNAVDDTTPTSPAVTTVTTKSHRSNWLYLSMIYTYIDDGGNRYNEVVAKASVLIPTYHNTSSAMWRKMPDYYQRIDTTGHLSKFINLFAWENDLYISLIDELMHLKSPDRVHYASLNNLATTSGVPFKSSELRPHQIRELISNSYKYNLQKGRADAVLSMMGVLSDSEVSFREFKTTGVSAISDYTRIKFSVCAERLNLIKDPRLKATPGTSATWHYLTNASAGSITAVDTPAGGSAGADPGIKFTTGASDAGTAYIFSNTPVQVKRGVPYYCNIDASTLVNATLQTRLYREKPISASSLPPEATYYTSDDSTGASHYKTMTSKIGTAYTSGEIIEQQGFAPRTGVAEANVVYTYSGANTQGKLFRAVLYTNTNLDLSDFTLKITPDGSTVSSSTRFDQFDLAVNNGTTDVLTADNLTLSVSGGVGTIIDEDDSSTVTKLTNTTGGVTYTLLIDEVANPAYAADTQLPSNSAVTFPFIDNGVEWLYPTIVVTLNNDANVLLDKFIFQPFSDGEYFDGTTNNAGQAIKSGATITRDYYWSGTTDNSVSIYTPLRGRQLKALKKTIREYLPITMIDSTSSETGTDDPTFEPTLSDANYYSATNTIHGTWVVADKTPGDEFAFDPHSWTANVYTEGTIKSLSN